MVASKTKSIVVTGGLWSLPGMAFGLATVVSGNLWVGATAALLGIIGARAISGRTAAALRNDQSVVTTEHAVDGMIQAVEVFWRPG